MKKLQYFAIVCVSLIFLLCATTVYAQECCPTPPTCIPTMACPIEMSAGQVEDPGSQALEKVSAGYKKVTQGVKTVRKGISKARKQATAVVDDVRDATVSAVKWPVKKLGTTVGLMKEDEDDKQGVTQDTSHGEDKKVEDRIIDNLHSYADESKGDYENEFFTVEKRKYIRQQTTITLMARMLVLKSHFKDMKKILDDIDAKVERDEANSSGAGDGKMSMEKNEAIILRSNQQLRIAWFKMLNYQRMIEAVKLEFAANQAIAGMKLVKTIPTIQSTDGKTGMVTSSTSGGK